jgi:hypothetical protein
MIRCIFSHSSIIRFVLIFRTGLIEEPTVALDSGYLTSPICKGLSDRKIFGVIAHRRYHPTTGLFPKWKFTYDKERDLYICPNNQELT